VVFCRAGSLENKDKGVEGSPESYVLRGGEAGAKRLRLLNRAKWPTTEPLLTRAGLQVGMRVLDVGCGSGEVTLNMAALVGAAGHVVGIDLDPAILDAARRGAEDVTAAVSFGHLAVEELEDAGAYDFVFARYLLSHLPHPGRAFAAMVRALRPGGRLAV